MSLMVFFVLSFFQRDVLDQILDLIESVSEGFPTYSQMMAQNQRFSHRLHKLLQLRQSRSKYGEVTAYISWINGESDALPAGMAVSHVR